MKKNFGNLYQRYKISEQLCENLFIRLMHLPDPTPALEQVLYQSTNKYAAAQSDYQNKQVNLCNQRPETGPGEEDEYDQSPSSLNTISPSQIENCSPTSTNPNLISKNYIDDMTHQSLYDENFKLDPTELAERVEQFRVNKKISRDALARSVLGISGITLGFLLRNTEPWDLMSTVNKYRLRKLHIWCSGFDENRPEDKALMFTSKWAGKYHSHSHKETGLDKKLNIQELSARITNLLQTYKIHVGFFSNRKLFVNKLYFWRLISCQLKWKNLTDDDRRVFKKIKTWADATPEQLMELKRQNDLENKRRAEFFKVSKQV
jgi:hypothetical protein